MKTGIFLLLAGTLLLAVSGCKTSVNSVENAQKTGQRQMVPDQRAVTDKSMASKVSIVGVNSAMTLWISPASVSLSARRRKRSLSERLGFLKAASISTSAARTASRRWRGVSWA